MFGVLDPSRDGATGVIEAEDVTVKSFVRKKLNDQVSHLPNSVPLQFPTSQTPDRACNSKMRPDAGSEQAPPASNVRLGYDRPAAQPAEQYLADMAKRLERA